MIGGDSMAKDGTRRGGARPGAGRKKKQQPEPPEKVLQLVPPTDEEHNEFPQFSRLLYDSGDGDFSLKQAEDVFISVYRYAKENDAAGQLPKELAEQFAVSYSRWVQAELDISRRGFLAPHPTTGLECKSPLVEVSNIYFKQFTNAWYSIWAIVKDGTKDDTVDDMSALLSGVGADGV